MKSAVGNQQLLHISSANYPGTCNHETQTQKEKHVLFYNPNTVKLIYIMTSYENQNKKCLTRAASGYDGGPSPPTHVPPQPIEPPVPRLIRPNIDSYPCPQDPTRI